MEWIADLAQVIKQAYTDGFYVLFNQMHYKLVLLQWL